MLSSEPERDLLRFLSSVRVVDNSGNAPMRCTLTQPPPCVGSSEGVSPGIVRGPSFSLGLAYPAIRSHVASLSELVLMSRPQLQLLAKMCHLSLPQSMALFSSIANMQESLPQPEAKRTLFAEGDVMVAALEGAAQTGLEVACRECHPAVFAREHGTRPAPCVELETSLVPRPPMSAMRGALRRNADLAAVDSRWSVATQLFSSLFVRKYRHILPEGDSLVTRLSWSHLYAILKEEEVASHHLASALQWWTQCLLMTTSAIEASRPTKKKKDTRRSKTRQTPQFPGPTISQLLGAIDKGSADGVRAVMAHYSPHGGPHVVELDAAVMRSPANRLRDAAFWKLFGTPKAQPGVVSQQILEREWKFNPQLAFPFIGFMIACATPGSFINAADLVKTASPKRRSAPRRPPPPVLPMMSMLVQ